jgi:CDP-paratose 2-epimerase
MRVLITGGAGFIGANAARRFLERGAEVTLYDDFSRRGARDNVAWLLSLPQRSSLRVVEADVRDFERLSTAARRQEVFVHLAGQVAVTTSVADPRRDFESNALGTFNALEAARLSGSDPVFLFASTNKVYGNLDAAPVEEEATRYRLRDHPEGIAEGQPLDFHSPYGCSKGAGDQYVRDYARIYGLRTVVFRQSATYGPRQFGMEDQGWLAWLLIAAVTGRPVTIYGDGKQVRDILHVDDLVDLYLLAVERIDAAAGEVFNAGGGPGNTISVWAEFGPLLESLLGRAVPVRFAPWRPGDQKAFVSDCRKAGRLLGWAPRTGVQDGIRALLAWIEGHKALLG